MEEIRPEQEALALWREKLAVLLKEEALEVIPDQKFRLEKKIEEARAKIAEFERDAPAASPKERPSLDDPDARRRSEELTRLYEEKRALTIAGADVREVVEAIRREKDTQRRGLDLAPGARLFGGRFEILEALGKGGFGRVWKAWDEDDHACVAVKVLFRHLLDERSKVERFFRGARWMAKLGHPHIVRVLEPHLVDEDDGWHFFVMEWIDGPDLERAVLEGGLTDGDKPRVLRQIGEALDYAHGQGLVHRDVKPSNILLDAGLVPKLTDFDLVRADDTETPYTATHAMMGTLHFAAPELLHSPRDAGPSCDVYSLASTAVFVLHGERLPVGYYKHPAKVIAGLGIPENMKAVLTQATEDEPEERHRGAGEFVEALMAAMVTSPPPEPESPPSAPAIVKAPPVEEELFRWIETPHDGRVELWREIPAGSFWMGSPEKESPWDDERPRHEVTGRSSFRMAAVPVTNAQYAAFDAEKADMDRPRHPVVNVSWHDAMKFCAWLSE